MPTTFATTTFVVLVGLNNYGALAPVDKALLPTGMTSAMLWSTEQCNYIRGKMENPEKYTCQVFRSEATTPWVYRAPGSSMEVSPEPEIKANPTSVPQVIPPAASPKAQADPIGLEANKPDAKTPIMYPVFYQIVPGICRYGGACRPQVRGGFVHDRGGLPGGRRH